MRYRLSLLSTAILLASYPAVAQTPPTPQTPPPAQTPAAVQTPATPPASLFGGSVDVGSLFSSVDGDEARYERYRDDRDGVYTGFRLNRDGEAYLFDASASHVGYRDQRYLLNFRNSNVKFNFQWDSLPLNYSYITRTPYTTDGGTLTLNDDAQRAVQGPTNATNDGTAVGVPCAPGALPAACANAAAATLAKANRSIYNDLSPTFDMRQQRDTAAFSLNYAATEAIDVDARFSSASKNGQQPWGASFAFNTGVELPMPLDQRTNDLSVGAAWANQKGMFRLGWDGSWFNNNIQTLVWDNPIRITDFSNGLLPPNGPYDPSGYSNGNSAAQGRMALAPSNMMNVVSATGLYKLRPRTTLNGALQLTSQTQDETLIPWTINSVINSPTVFAAFPGLAQLPRPTAEAEAKGVNALLNFNSRALRLMNFTARYRYNKRDVETPQFDAREYVRFDGVPEEIEAGLSHQFDSSRHLFDANVSTPAARWGTFRVGYGNEQVERHGRGFSDVTEHIFRVSFDTYANQYLSARASFDTGRRRGEGFVETGIDYESGPGGEQPTLRYYDEADRNRSRGSLLLTVMPRDTVDVYFSIAGGKDEYLADDSVPVTRPGELFGMQESAVTSWNIGFNAAPSAMVAFGGNFGRETISQLQLSRNANPPPDPSWTDPNRNWTLDNDETVNNANLYIDVLRAIRNTDIRFSYDYSDSDNAFVHGGPRIAALASLNQFIPLPNVENTWHRASADFRYFFTARAGIGVGYYYEKLDIADFNTIDTNGPVGFATATGEPRIDWLGGLLTGYGNRPYDGQTVSVRLLYLF